MSSVFSSGNQRVLWIFTYLSAYSSEPGNIAPFYSTSPMSDCPARTRGHLCRSLLIYPLGTLCCWQASKLDISAGLSRASGSQQAEAAAYLLGSSCQRLQTTGADGAKPASKQAPDSKESAGGEAVAAAELLKDSASLIAACVSTLAAVCHEGSHEQQVRSSEDQSA